jgi:hypothetical protein
MKGGAINSGTGVYGTCYPSATPGVWYAVNVGVWQTVRFQLLLNADKTFRVIALDAAYCPSPNTCNDPNGLVNDTRYGNCSPAASTVQTVVSPPGFGYGIGYIAFSGTQ